MMTDPVGAGKVRAVRELSIEQLAYAAAYRLSDQRENARTAVLMVDRAANTVSAITGGCECTDCREAMVTALRHLADAMEAQTGTPKIH